MSFDQNNTGSLKDWNDLTIIYNILEQQNCRGTAHRLHLLAVANKLVLRQEVLRKAMHWIDCLEPVPPVKKCTLYTLGIPFLIILGAGVYLEKDGCA